MEEYDYIYAVVTNKHDQFRSWKYDTFDNVRGGSDFIYNRNRYLSVTKADHCSGWHFNGVIIPDYVDQRANKLIEILHTIDYCFRTN